MYYPQWSTTIPNSIERTRTHPHWLRKVKLALDTSIYSLSPALLPRAALAKPCHVPEARLEHALDCHCLGKLYVVQ